MRAKIPGIEVCGKTGSAQTVSNEYVRSHGKASAQKDNSWFVGFAPRSAPEIAVVAMFEGGEHGMLSAPIARDVMKSYFDKKARQKLLTQNPQASPAVQGTLATPAKVPRRG